MDKPSESENEKTRTSGGWWIVQVFTGGLLILILGLHMIAHHFVAANGIRNFREVLDYVGNPLIFVIEMIFVVVVTIHALLGVRAILFDLGPKPAVAAWINRGLVILGAATIVYGFWLGISLQALK
jgi:succinate dehydrogenase hydrophobic anchor subunit